MTVSELLAIFFPHLACLRVDRVFRAGRSVRIQARTCTSEAGCPSCGASSRRAYGRYERRICGNPVGERETLIHLLVRRFFCRYDACGKKTFAEQVPGLTVRYSRRSTGLNTTLQAIALALSGRAGARLAGRLATAVNRMTLIWAIRALPGPVVTEGPRVLGVDFALRRGRAYGTIRKPRVRGELKAPQRN